MRCVINAKTHFSIRRKNTSGINVPNIQKIGKRPNEILQRASTTSRSPRGCSARAPEGISGHCMRLDSAELLDLAELLELSWRELEEILVDSSTLEEDSSSSSYLLPIVENIYTFINTHYNTCCNSSPPVSSTSIYLLPSKPPTPHPCTLTFSCRSKGLYLRQ